MSKVADSEELQAKIGEQIDAEALIGLGAECGCEFTAEELQEAAELSDDELDEVAGGKNAGDYPWWRTGWADGTAGVVLKYCENAALGVTFDPKDTKPPELTRSK